MERFKRATPDVAKVLDADGTIREQDITITQVLQPGTPETVAAYKRATPKVNKFLMADGRIVEGTVGAGGTGASDAIDVNYSNLTSGLSSTDVQNAIDEIVEVTKNAAVGQSNALLYVYKNDNTGVPTVETPLNVWGNIELEYDDTYDAFMQDGVNTSDILLNDKGVYSFIFVTKAVQSTATLSTLTTKMYVNNIVDAENTRVFTLQGNNITLQVNETFVIDTREITTFPVRVKFTNQASLVNTTGEKTRLKCEYIPAEISPSNVNSSQVAVLTTESTSGTALNQRDVNIENVAKIKDILTHDYDMVANFIEKTITLSESSAGDHFKFYFKNMYEEDLNTTGLVYINELGEIEISDKAIASNSWCEINFTIDTVGLPEGYKVNQIALVKTTASDEYDTVCITNINYVRNGKLTGTLEFRVDTQGPAKVGVGDKLLIQAYFPDEPPADFTILGTSKITAREKSSQVLQRKYDTSFQTVSKTVTGAVNEVFNKVSTNVCNETMLPYNGFIQYINYSLMDANNSPYQTGGRDKIKFEGRLAVDTIGAMSTYDILKFYSIEENFSSGNEVCIATSETSQVKTITNYGSSPVLARGTRYDVMAGQELTNVIFNAELYYESGSGVYVLEGEIFSFCMENNLETTHEKFKTFIDTPFPYIHLFTIQMEPNILSGYIRTVVEPDNTSSSLPSTIVNATVSTSPMSYELQHQIESDK